MTSTNEIAEFLTSRRARVIPEQVGLPTYGQCRCGGSERCGPAAPGRGDHPVVGQLELAYEVLDLSADDGLTISVYSADPGSRSQEALDLLASWTAAPERSPTTVDE